MISLRQNEKVYLIKHRHRVVLMKSLSLEILIFGAIIIFIFLLFSTPISWPNFLIKFIPSLLEFEIRNLLLFFLSLLLLILWAIIFFIITDYYLDCWIVTNERTIHTKLRGLFNRISSSVNHDRIQDITIDIRGILPTILNYGNLSIQTAGEFRQFVFEQIPDPYKTRDIIFKAQKEYLKKMKKDGLI